MCGYDVPRELEEQILLKLSVKSLLRFRSVCKDWNSLISGDMFVNEHLQLQKTNPSSSFFVRWNEDLEEIHLLDGYCSLSGSYCNGIVCLVADCSISLSEQIFFYNPALKEHELIRTLPRGNLFVSWGFGHDPRTDDYKFVRMWKPTYGVNKAEVYTLRTGRWREIKLEKHSRISYGAGAYMKGRLYWSEYPEEDTLVWFDMSEERFGTIVLPLPRPCDRLFPSTELLVWNDSLVFFFEFLDSFEMWVADGELGGWSKFYKIEPLASVEHPIVFWKEDELLIEGKDGSMMSYNLGTKKLEEFSIPRFPRPCTTSGSLYVETLVSVKPRLVSLSLDL